MKCYGEVSSAAGVDERGVICVPTGVVPAPPLRCVRAPTLFYAGTLVLLTVTFGELGCHDD